MSNHYYDEGPPATGKKVLLAVPTYACPDTSLTFALARGREALSEAGIQSALLILEGNCHVDDARNSVVRDFLESDCTELMFLDADVCFEPADLARLCSRGKDIVGGVYPYRREGGDTMPCRMAENPEVIDGLREMDGLPTGFMKIHRSVFEKMAPTRPVYNDKTSPTVLFFDRPPPDENGVRWGGDLDFCNRWKAMGGKIYADEELRLGHAAKVIVRDSLAAYVRRGEGTTIRHLVPKFREGTETEGDYNELFRFANNLFAADPSVLAACVEIARKCQGPVIETGSGLSTLLMGAVCRHKVYSLEHLPHYAEQTDAWCVDGGVDATILCAPLNDGWYDVERMAIPDKFAFGFCDGPPRMYGTRMRFFDVFGPRCSIILVDDIASDRAFSDKVRQWAEDNNRSFMVLGRCALLQKVEVPALQEAA